MRVHIIPSGEDGAIVYCPDSLKFFTTSKSTASLASKIAEGATYEMVLADYPDVSHTAFDSILEKLSLNGVREPGIDNGVLPRLVINVSNDCNMRCGYCYASCGTYGSEKSLMDDSVLKKALDYFYSAYKSIGIVQLFGGEPTLNPKAIATVCEYFKERNTSTRIGFVTNATLVDNELIETINRYDVDVTVSVDVERVHDALRPLSNGRPSWHLVRRNIRLLQERTSQPTTIELTYTKTHLDLGLSIADVLMELKEDYGQIPTHVTPVCSHDPRYRLPNREAFVDSVHDVFEKNKMGERINYSILEGYALSLKLRNPSRYVCNAGVGTLAVSTSGDIYPCFYFIGKPDFAIANVSDDTKDIDESILAVKNRYLSYRLSELEQCKECFANTLCHGCLGSNVDVTGKQLISPEDHCTMTRKIIDMLLYELSAAARP